MNTDNLIVIALQNHGTDVVMHSVNNASWRKLDHSLGFAEAWANPALARYILSRVFGCYCAHMMQYPHHPQPHLVDYVCVAMDWSLLKPEFVMELVWEIETRRFSLPAAKMAGGWRGTFEPRVWQPTDLEPYLETWRPEQDPKRASHKRVFIARVLRREKLFQIPLPPHLLLGMCEFL